MYIKRKVYYYLNKNVCCHNKKKQKVPSTKISFKNVIQVRFLHNTLSILNIILY